MQVEHHVVMGNIQEKGDREKIRICSTLAKSVRTFKQTAHLSAKKWMNLEPMYHRTSFVRASTHRKIHANFRVKKLTSIVVHRARFTLRR